MKYYNPPISHILFISHIFRLFPHISFISHTFRSFPAHFVHIYCVGCHCSNTPKSCVLIEGYICVFCYTCFQALSLHFLFSGYMFTYPVITYQAMFSCLLFSVYVFTCPVFRLSLNHLFSGYVFTSQPG